jgi:uncharacterized phage-associated protein
MRGEFMPDQIADYLLRAAREQGEVLTNLKLQKLLYYAQAWHLALHDRALFDEDFQAWVHGPVLRSQYARFRDYQWKPITEDVPEPNLPNDVRRFLDEILEVFGSETAISLERMTHAERPWIEARGNLPPDANSTNRISKESMQRFYRSLQEA